MLKGFSCQAYVQHVLLLLRLGVIVLLGYMLYKYSVSETFEIFLECSSEEIIDRDHCILCLYYLKGYPYVKLFFRMDCFSATPYLVFNFLFSMRSFIELRIHSFNHSLSCELLIFRIRRICYVYRLFVRSHDHS